MNRVETCSCPDWPEMCDCGNSKPFMCTCEPDGDLKLTNETKHTAGPWEIKPEEVDKPYIRIRGSVLGGRYKIANVLTPIYEGAPEREAEETRANARLIAAAPDLLFACQYALRHLTDKDGKAIDPHHVSVTEWLETAIAKAKGE